MFTTAGLIRPRNAVARFMGWFVGYQKVYKYQLVILTSGGESAG